MRITTEKIVPDNVEDYRGFKIEITQDEDARNPREDYNVGTMCCEHNRYTLGDGGMRQLYDSLIFDPRYYDLYDDLPDDELEPFEDDDYPALLAQAKKWGYVVLPLFLYDHSGITMSCAPFHCPWDSGQVGIIFCSPQKRAKEGMTVPECTNYLKGEVATYDQYLTGDVWGYVIKDEDGEEVDSLWGLYGEDYALSEAKSVVDAEILGREDQ